MLEINVEKECTFETLRSAVSKAFSVKKDNILPSAKYWDQDFFGGLLGLGVEHGPGEYETMVTIDENPSMDRDLQDIGIILSRALQCKVAIPYAQNDMEEISGLVLMFSSGNFVGRGFGEQTDSGYSVFLK